MDDFVGWSPFTQNDRNKPISDHNPRVLNVPILDIDYHISRQYVLEFDLFVLIVL
jgi:hypothetical protein